MKRSGLNYISQKYLMYQKVKRRDLIDISWCRKRWVVIKIWNKLWAVKSTDFGSQRVPVMGISQLVIANGIRSDAYKEN